VRLAVLNWRDLAHSDSGGAEVFVDEVTRRWVDAGNHVTLYSSGSLDLPSSDARHGVRIERVGRLKTGSHHLRAPSKVKSGFDVVLESVNTVPYFLPYRLRSGPPFVALVHQMAVDVWDAHLPRLLAKAARRIEPQWFRPYRKIPVAAVSESTRTDLHAAGVSNVTVIPQGGLGPSEARSEARPEKAPVPTFLFVGRLAANKRPDHAVEAFRLIRRQIPDANLWVVGTGEMAAELESSLPEGAELLGRLERAELLDRMTRAHMLLVTSIREGWGLVVTEANALGTPAIAYDVPGLRDSIQDGRTGLLVSPAPETLAKEAIQLTADSSRYERLRREAIAWGSACSWDKTASALLNLLEEARSAGNRTDP
jgi:glycosyltransferase involved in cell wall biosynthesis